MRILIDENIPESVGHWLTQRGHDVAYAAAIEVGADDLTWAMLSHRDGHVVVTRDKGFGKLAFAEGQPPSGVVLVRLPDASSSDLLERFTDTWPLLENQLPGAFVVISWKGHRVRPIEHNG
jgi:predicted nuclease of predicted toxin-antitoxin system